MSKRSTRIAAAAAITLALSYPCLAETPAPQPAEGTGEIQAIRARIAELEAKVAAEHEQHRLQENRMEAELTNRELTAEAARQDHFITANRFTAGYTDGRFVLQSEDGNFLFHPWAHFQFRDVVLDRKGFQGTAKHPEDEVDNGYEVRQLRFGADGKVFSPDVTYFINWATTRTSGAATAKSSTGATVGTVSNNLGGVPVLQQAWVKYHFPTTPFFIKAGELKDPLLHEQIVDTRYQQGTERSLTGDIFANGDAFTEAVTFIYDPDTFIRVEGGVNHGLRGANTNFLDYPNNGTLNSVDYGLVGRLEYKVMGRWKDYTQVGGVGTKEQLLVFGTGADYSERGHDGQLVAVADAMYACPCGFNLYGELVDRYTTHNFGYYTQSASGATITAGNPAVAGKATNEYAVVGEVGYIIDQHLEPFGRYEYIHLQGTPAGSRNWVQAIAGGANYYFYGHRLKVTGEAIWLPSGLPFDDSPNDVLANPTGKPELSFIAQLQLLL